MTRRNKATSIEVLPRHDPDVAKLVNQAIEKKIAEAFSSDDLFRPFFESKRGAYEIREKQTVAQKNKWIYFFEDYGCLLCRKKNLGYQATGMCSSCYRKTALRLKTSLAKRAPAPGQEVRDTFLDTVKLAREALRPSLAALAAENEVELASDSPKLRTHGEAAKEAGIDSGTLSGWLATGKVQHPQERMSEKRWLWSDEDIARLKEIKVRPRGRPKMVVDVTQIAQLRAEGKSLHEIGLAMGCSRDTVSKALEEASK